MNNLKSINLIKNLNKFNSIRTITNSEHLIYPKGEKTIQVEEDNNQTIFACIHLEPTFPYEHTKPLPNVKQIEKLDSVLKNELKREDLFKKDPSLLEVQKLTYTSEYFWRKKYNFKKTYNKRVLKPREGP